MKEDIFQYIKNKIVTLGDKLQALELENENLKQELSRERAKSGVGKAKSKDALTEDLQSKVIQYINEIDKCIAVLTEIKNERRKK